MQAAEPLTLNRISRITAHGATTETVTVPAGTPVKIVNTCEGEALVSYQGAAAWVPVAALAEEWTA